MRDLCARCEKGLSAIAEIARFSERSLDGFQQNRHFQQMLKESTSYPDFETRVETALRELFAQVPSIRVKKVVREYSVQSYEPDLLANITVAGDPHTVVVECKNVGQPRIVRTALLQLRDYVSRSGKSMTPLFAAPYLSPQTREMCREQEVAYLDLEGNARFVLDPVFVERTVPTKPLAEKRALRSLFKPKAASVLKTLLREPPRPWRVTELAHAARVSLGHVSSVKARLLDREWAQATGDGLLVSEPGKLLDAWRNAYEPPAGKRLGFYTTLHGSAFEKVALTALNAGPRPGRAIFAAQSAAHWLAPYGRTGTQYFYADVAGLEELRDMLKLSSAAKGENVVVTVPKHEDLLLDTVEPSTGALCTGVVQTYLDLTVTGERGREAADHLRARLLPWTQ